MGDTEILIDPISHDLQAIEGTGTCNIIFRVEVKHLCWSSKLNPACPLHDCEHMVCVPPSQFFPAATRPHIHVRLPESCVFHDIPLCEHQTKVTAEHHFALLLPDIKVGTVLLVTCGPFPWHSV